jgi:CRISPR-associated protein Csd1
MTNADRLMNRFSTHPFTTWQTIEMSLKPYLEKLNGGGAASREKLLDEIMSLFDPNGFKDDRALSGEFLLGYHCQRYELNKRKDVVTDEEENGGNE